MLGSVCCGHSVSVETTEDGSFYICTKCRLPADGRRHYKETEMQDVQIQPPIAS